MITEQAQNERDLIVSSYATALERSARQMHKLKVSLDAQRVRRDFLICRLLETGMSERTVGKLAGLSGPSVHDVKRKSQPPR